MRIDTSTRVVEMDPGSATQIVVDVVNTAQVIDGVSARIIGLPQQYVRAEPLLLPLFPDASGRLTLSLTVPPSHPAGRHPLTVEVVSHGAKVASEYLDVDLDVHAQPVIRLEASPRTITARRRGRFVLDLINQGNIGLDVNLRAAEADRACALHFSTDTIRVPAGSTAAVVLDVRGPRMIAGGVVERAVSLEAVAVPVDLAGADLTPESAPEPLTAIVRLRQKPLLSRGMITALTLACIVALWAGVFLFGLARVFSGDPMTKTAPASFFTETPGADGAAKPGVGSDGAPAGALSKTGQMPAGSGGTIAGTVISASEGRPVGRILVEAIRVGPKGAQVVSSAATQSDGTYSLVGLFPGKYYVSYRASGFRTAWYPRATSRTAATPVDAVAQGTTTASSVVVTGNPASISGTVNLGDTLKHIVTTVVARPLLSMQDDQPAATAKTNASGGYTLTDLPAPATYELTFTAAGYRTTTLVDTINGGDVRLEPTVLLGTGTGEISGTVTAGGKPLGGVTISTTVGGKPLTILTPTMGQVGSFVLGSLPTPATYVITFAADGFGSQTTIIDLAAGQKQASLNTRLTPGTGSVSGRLVDGDGNGLGGATVTVGGTSSTGGAAAPTTTTLTSGSVGSFRINGLAAPGEYTMTFTKRGFAPVTIPVALSGSSAPPVLQVQMSTKLGSVTGRVLADGKVFVGATIRVTNGNDVLTTTSAGAGGALPDGGYLIGNLVPGSYAITASAPGFTQQTRLVTITAGERTHAPLELGS
jgi:hypothetical protein